jgi:hypothetical protein
MNTSSNITYSIIKEHSLTKLQSKQYKTNTILCDCHGRESHDGWSLLPSQQEKFNKNEAVNIQLEKMSIEPV